MFPGYKPYLNIVALSQVIKPVHVPNYHLGIYPYELLTNVGRTGSVRTMPEIRQNVTIDNAAFKGQTTEGVPGFGNIIPDISPGEVPYYGEFIGGY